jgi:hypothetical protein
MNDAVDLGIGFALGYAFAPVILLIAAIIVGYCMRFYRAMRGVSWPR